MKLKKIILTGVLSVAMFVGSVIPSMAAELTPILSLGWFREHLEGIR